MKQPEDTYTVDLLSNETTPLSKDVELYTFHMTTLDGELVEWRNLSLRQAQSMHKWTEDNLPPNVKSYGWEVQVRARA